MDKYHNDHRRNTMNERTRIFTITSMFAAVIFLLAFTPIGFLNLIVIKATVIHIPVIIGSIILGPRVGALLGFFFGLSSFINNTLAPSSILSFAFSPLVPVPGTDGGSPLALLVCFVPRILVGVVPYYVNGLAERALGRSVRARAASSFIAGVCGGMTNTLLVMGLIYILFRDAYAARAGIDTAAVLSTVLGIIFFQGGPESIVAGILTSGVGRALTSALKLDQNP